jgi:hypothetical protein
MRSRMPFVCGLETSGERGPSPLSPFFGSHGAGAGGFCVLSFTGMADTTDFQFGKQIKAVGETRRYRITALGASATTRG